MLNIGSRIFVVFFSFFNNEIAHASLYLDICRKQSPARVAGCQAQKSSYFFFFFLFLFSQIDIKSNISSLPCFDSLRELLSIINVKTIRIYISIYFCFREVVRVISERSKTNDFVVPCKSCPSTDRVNGSILSILRDLIFLLFFFFFYVLVKKNS